MKTLKNIALTLAALTLTATTTFAADPMPSTPGSDDSQPAFNAADVNGDGKVTTADMWEVLKHYGEQFKGSHAADVNGDGSIGIGDLLAVIKALS